MSREQSTLLIVHRFVIKYTKSLINDALVYVLYKDFGCKKLHTVFLYVQNTQESQLGGALGPDWHAGLELRGKAQRTVNLETEVEVARIMEPAEFKKEDKTLCRLHDDEGIVTILQVDHYSIFILYNVLKFFIK